MNARQYAWTHRNARRYDPAPLRPAEDARGLLRAAARSAAWQAELLAAWRRVVPPAFRAVTSVDGFLDGCLTIAVTDVTACHALRQAAVGLRAALAAEVPGVCRLRFCLGRAAPGERAADTGHGATGEPA